MNNVSMAKSYIRQAYERLKHAKEAFESGNYPYVVRQWLDSVKKKLWSYYSKLHSGLFV